MILILLISWVLLAVSVKDNECLLKFLDEPPTQLNCTPYGGCDDDGDDCVYKYWNLRLACEVRVPVGNGSVQYEVHWFQRNNESNITDHGRPEWFQKTTFAERVLFGTHLFDQKFTAAMLGDYWCQAILTDRQPPVYLSKSNILTVREPDYYNSSLPTCSNVQYIRKSRCISNITVVLPLSNETLSLISTTTSISPTSTLTMREIIGLKTKTILRKSSIRLPINLTSKSEQLQLSSSATPVSISKRNNDTNYLLITILITVTIVLLFITILAVIIIAKRKKTKSDFPTPNQQSDETKDKDNKDRESINTTEAYYIVPDSSSTMSYYTAQDPDNPQYQSLNGGNYVSIYDDVNKDGTHHKYAAINPNQVEKNVYSSLRNKTTIK